MKCRKSEKPKYLSIISFINICLIQIMCPIITKAETMGEVKINHSIILASVRNFTRTTDDLYVSQARNGSAFIKTDEGYGIMAVVHNMNLQSINSDYKTICSDYLQISELNGTGTTGNVCGSSETSNYYVPPTFVDKTGEIELNYVLQEKYRMSPFEGTYVNFNITFTPFTECPEDAFPYGNEYLRPCSTMDTFSCIPVEYFCDGIVNCGFSGEYALDEIYCQKKKNVTTESLNNEQEEEPLIFDYDFEYLPGPPLEQSTTNPNMFNIVYTRNSLPLGLFGVIILFITLFSLSRMNKMNHRMTQHFDINQNINKMDSSSLTNLIQNAEYDIESDPAPSYEQCLINPNAELMYITELHFESEQPPAYEEIKVHMSCKSSHEGV